VSRSLLTSLVPGKRFVSVASLVGLILLLGAQQAQASEQPVLLTGRMAEALGPNYATRSWAVNETGDLASHEVVMVTSLAQFRAAVIPAGTTVMYDLEHWAYTPKHEWEYPTAALRTFVKEAHARGLVALLAPGFSALRYSLGCHQRQQELPITAYLRCFAPIRTDLLLFQSQGVECSPSLFATEVRAVSAVSRAPVIAELSVVPNRWCITAGVLMQDVEIVGGWTDRIAVWGLGMSARTNARPDQEQVAMLVAFFLGYG
jgi:hypothetical protein